MSNELTPDGLVNRLGSVRFCAATVVFLTETLVGVIAATTSGDEAARKELLKHISDMLVSVANTSSPAGAPVAGKP